MPSTGFASSTPATGAGHAVARFALSFDAPRAARNFVVEALRQGAQTDLCPSAALVVAELAANAVIHAGSPFVVEVSTHPDVVRVAVHDASPVLPAPREAAPLASTGRGLHLVAGLASRWGSELRPGGKVVWAEFSR
jgi:anti-sigma regulatory factor (Ser/Thr protein kinase)